MMRVPSYVRMISVIVACCIAFVGFRGNELRSETKADYPAQFKLRVENFLKAHCNRCHGTERPRGQLTLSTYNNEPDARKDRLVWEKVLQRVNAKEMPPPGRSPQPTAEEIAGLRQWIDNVLGVDDCTTKKDPGRLALRRLNRNEYNNTIRDLLGVEGNHSDDFPADDVGYGFDNNGDVLSLPPILMEKYLASAERIVEQVWANPKLRQKVWPFEGAEATEEQARKNLESLAKRAYRGPTQGEEINRLYGLIKTAKSHGDSTEDAVKTALQAVLVSPHFLFRVERGKQGLQNAFHAVSDFEFASRLSYFIWSSMPDEELFREARQGTLRRNIDPQVERMLKDSKALALVENFATQWLYLRNLRSFSPDPAQFPDFDEPLRHAMLRETEMFFENMIKQDLSILDFLDADYTFVNERLARHYGIAGVKGDSFRRVSLMGTKRAGIVTHASILSVTSNPTRTSPVKRGKWILENIFGTPPPPPPPDVPELNDDKEVVLTGTLRQRMVQHRANPNCATCHQRMDPLGFGLENFDAVGAWREKDGNFPIDSSGVLPDGRSFKGPTELVDIFRGESTAFAKTLAEKMLTFATGRGMESTDKCAVENAVSGLRNKKYRFSALILEVVKSDPFQMRRGRRGDS